ncbi:hypothetical protein CEXT_22411 [Caerostris extrusa]|uniref:Uncharacterized protein n=1 Tax=Caerostris extrusa TaxID=172846 RepID=A0AAV4VJB4_CAEEX|nr:hypothetical protein CEXT_22411 [Caerostris extrusa]
MLNGIHTGFSVILWTLSLLKFLETRCYRTFIEIDSLWGIQENWTPSNVSGDPMDSVGNSRKSGAIDKMSGSGEGDIKKRKLIVGRRWED